ncbi:uncharacterized protein EMH_0019490 [Eimeria mitis]|uniref:Transmembrane protein n=1 Tax=Eimeria mitis TaxID=44415 RepID=U6K8C6_9EIME|nr:uncharacterized protein EMH_0019490 [Eimeria mitis]CDJ34260.1 hypothetical protein EMH_0019490 [Eimeria mitis]
MHGISSSSKREGAIRFTPLPPPRARSLLAVVTTIFAIVYLAYVCSVSIGRRITALPLSRSLAQSSGGEDCGESDGSHSTGSPAETSPEGQFATVKELDYAAGGMEAQSGNTEPNPSSDAATAAPGKAISGTAAPQLETQGRRTGVKRKGEEQSTVERGAKKLIRETPIVEAPLQPGSPPLDPRLDSLIDSVLSGGSTVFSEAFWLLNEAEQESVEDGYIESRPGALGTDSRTPVVETPQRPPPTPLDPGLDSLIDSVLYESADILSGDAWLLDDEPPHPTPDYSILSIPPALGGDSGRTSTGQPTDKLVHAPPSRPCALRADGKEPKAEGGSEGPSPLGTSGRQMQRGPPAVVEPQHRGLSPRAAGVTKESPQPPVAEALAPAEEGTASTSTAPVEDSLASSSRASSASQHLPFGVTPSQESGSAEQVGLAVCYGSAK